MPDQQDEKRKNLLQRIIMLVTPSDSGEAKPETEEDRKRREERERDRAEMDKLLGN